MCSTPPTSLLAIADYSLLGESLPQKVKEAVDGGIDWVLLRAKEASEEVASECAKEILALCPGIFLTVHGRLSAPGAKGIHLPSGPLEDHRDGIAKELLLGISCHSMEEATRAEADGADYIFLGPLFPPTSKEIDYPLLGEVEFSKVAEALSIPVYALGGLTPEKAETVFELGAAGVAVLGDLFLSPSVKVRAGEWTHKIKELNKGKR